MKKNSAHGCKRILTVIPDSIAEEAGIRPGDSVIEIDGRKFKDVFDYRLMILKQHLVIGLVDANGQQWEVEIQKDEDEDLGIEFVHPLIDYEKRCENKCIFCFVDQLPDGMRDSLYFKDDDTRLSFLSGNYITMTNMDDDELDRMIGMRFSPFNVSVHTTNPCLREFMMGNRRAGNIIKRLKRLTGSGLLVNTQIVVCRGLNDGKELDRTLDDLAGLCPEMNSISVVPVGLTRHREGLYPLMRFDRKSAAKTVSQVESHQRENMKKFGRRVVFAADELYLAAGMDIPLDEEYEDYPQVENGVGMFALFRHDFHEELDRHNGTGIISKNISIATGSLAEGFIKELVQKMHINVYSIENDFFGKDVTVSGLVTGQDLVKQLKGRDLGDELLIPSNMLKAGEKIFLDDYTVDMVRDRLGVDVTPVEVSGRALAEKIIQKDVKRTGR